MAIRHKHLLPAPTNFLDAAIYVTSPAVRTWTNQTEFLYVPRPGGLTLFDMGGVPVNVPTILDLKSLVTMAMECWAKIEPCLTEARWMPFVDSHGRHGVTDTKAHRGAQFYVANNDPLLCKPERSYTAQVTGSGASEKVTIHFSTFPTRAAANDAPTPPASGPQLSLPAAQPVAPSKDDVSGEVDVSDAQRPERGTMAEALDLFSERKPLPKSVRVSLDFEVDANTAEKLCDMYLWRWAQVNGLGGELTLEAFLRKTFTDAAEALEEERVPFALKAG